MLKVNSFLNSKGEIDVVRWFTNKRLQGENSNLFIEFEEMLNGMTKKEIMDFIKRSDLNHTYYKTDWGKEDIINKVVGCLNLSTAMLILDNVNYDDEDETWQNIDKWLKKRGR